MFVSGRGPLPSSMTGAAPACCKTLCRCCHLVLVSGNIVRLLAQMVPPVSKMRPPLLSLPVSPWVSPPPPMVGPNGGGVGRGAEFNKGSLSHMLKRYANVQVLLFSDVPLPIQLTALLSKPKPNTERGCVWERVWVFVFQSNGLFC